MNGCWGWLGTFLMLLLVGCTTSGPFKAPTVLPQDGEEYAGERSMSVYYKARVVSKAEIAVYNDSTAASIKLREQAAKDAEDSVVDFFSRLGKFSIIDRTNGIAVTSSRMVKGQAASADKMDKHGDAVAVRHDVVGDRNEMEVVLQVDTSVIFRAKWMGNTTHPKKARGVKVTSRFRLVEPKTLEVLHGISVVAEVDCDRRDCRSAIQEACRQNAGKFAMLIGARLLVPGLVMETRGAGRYARLSIGKNYQLTDGADGRLPTQVVFYERMKNQTSGGRRGRKIVGRGTVVWVGRNSAWVEGDANWGERFLGNASYGVRRGHFVRVTEESLEKELKADGR